MTGSEGAPVGFSLFVSYVTPCDFPLKYQGTFWCVTELIGQPYFKKAINQNWVALTRSNTHAAVINMTLTHY